MIKIEFEGTDGAGKTTGLKYFIEQAKKQGLTVTETREVGNPHIPACVKMRELVLDPKSNLRGESMELIFSAMRYENEKWLQSVETDLVVSDRGWFSHLAYTDHNVDEGFTNDLYLDLVAFDTSLPDVVIYFDVNTETALSRRNNRGTSDVIEMKGVPFQEKVRSSFEKYLEKSKRSVQIFTINANDTLDGVRIQLDKILTNIMNETDKYRLDL